MTEKDFPDDACLRDYAKLNGEYRRKAGTYIKNLLKIQRAENGMSAKLFRLDRTQAAGQGTDPEKCYCSFCNKSQDDVSKLIAGPSSVYICDECARLCGEILDEVEAEEAGNGQQHNPEMGKTEK